MCMLASCEVKAKTIIVEQSEVNVHDFPKHEKELTIKREKFTITIKEPIGVIRKIQIDSANYVNTENLYFEYAQLEKLLMLLEGSFSNITKLKFENGIDESQNELLQLKGKEYMDRRLLFYNTNNVFKTGNQKLCDWEKILTDSIYSNWITLLEELDIVHQIVLYTTADNGVPMELKLPFLIECAEPLIELITIETGRFSSLSPGNRGTSLKKCLGAIISSYGMDIFSGEYAEPVEFTQRLVNTRVRIMHIKRNSEKDVIAGIDIHLYAIKMSLLYRRVLLDLLGVDYRIYSQNLKRIVTVWEKHIEQQKIFSIEKS